jgi:hypothetical protein
MTNFKETVRNAITHMGGDYSKTYEGQSVIVVSNIVKRVRSYCPWLTAIGTGRLSPISST